MRRSLGTWGCSLLTLLILSTAALAQEVQVIYLKDGSTIRGNVVHQDATMLLVETDYGKLEVPKANVLRVEYATGGAVQPQTAFPGAAPEQMQASQFHVKPKKEPCLGCFFAWLIPGAGMVYAEEYGWAAGYFCVGMPLMIWTAVEIAEAGPYGSPDLPPLLILAPFRLIEYVHTYASLNAYNKRYGWAFDFDRATQSAYAEYRFAPYHDRLQTALALDCPAGEASARVGLKVRF